MSEPVTGGNDLDTSGDQSGRWRPRARTVATVLLVPTALAALASAPAVASATMGSDFRLPSTAAWAGHMAVKGDMRDELSGMADLLGTGDTRKVTALSTVEQSYLAASAAGLGLVQLTPNPTGDPTIARQNAVAAATAINGALTDTERDAVRNADIAMTAAGSETDANHDITSTTFNVDVGGENRQVTVGRVPGANSRDTSYVIPDVSQMLPRSAATRLQAAQGGKAWRSPYPGQTAPGGQGAITRPGR